MGKDTKFLATLPTRRIHRVLHIEESLRYRGLHLGLLRIKMQTITATQTVGKVATGFIEIYIQIICYARGLSKKEEHFYDMIFTIML
ncbi:hypothetical protein SFRURICE_005903 [Spodoptera frugiperda]|nr:hypothetical protein SFRURICE_005903 [Spodoptera frugiperda]